MVVPYLIGLLSGEVEVAGTFSIQQDESFVRNRSGMLMTLAVMLTIRMMIMTTMPVILMMITSVISTQMF